MLADTDAAFVLQQAVENMRGLADGCRYNLGMKGREAIGDVGIELDARLTTIAGVCFSAAFSLASCSEELAVRGRRITVPEKARERLRMDGID
jgi:hypothetical protein